MKQKIKIIHLITGLNTGGAEMMLYKLLSRINKKEFDCTVISLTGEGTLGRKISALGVTVHTLGMKSRVPSLLGCIKLFRLLRNEKPHALQTWLYHADLLGLLIGKAAGVPRIFWNIRCSNMDMKHYSKLTYFVAWFLAKLSSIPEMVLVNSESGKDLHEELGYTPQEWKIIPNGFDTEVFKPDKNIRLLTRKELGVTSDCCVIGMIARFDPMKDHRSFFKASQILAKEFSNLRFVLIGRGLESDNVEVARIVKEMKISENVKLLGERSDISKLMTAMDIMCLSSAFGEGFPNVIGEAMSCGTPCVVTDVGDSRLIVGDTGRVVAPRQPDNLAAAVRDLISLGESLRSTLGLMARQRIIENYSLDTVVGQYEAIYVEALK